MEIINAFVYVTVSAVRLLLTVLQLLMFARAIMSWIMPDDGSPVVSFIIGVTEPVIAPIRALLSRFEFFNNMPIDISFMVAYVLLIFVYNALPVVHI